MKIEWICEEEREVPRVGLMVTGTIRDVEKEIGEALIRQGLAEEVKKKKPETGKEKAPDEGGED